MQKYKRYTSIGTHIIESGEVLSCAETGRVIAVFNSKDDLDYVFEKLNKKPDVKKSDLDIMFDEFYNAGMRKMDPVRAKKLFIKRAKECEQGPVYFTSMVLGDIQERIRIKQYGFDGLHPTTYLNKKRWLDEIKPSQPIGNQSQSPMKMLTDTSWAPNLIEGDA